MTPTILLTAALIGILGVLGVTRWSAYQRAMRIRAMVEEQNRRRMLDLQPKCAMITNQN